MSFRILRQFFPRISRRPFSTTHRQNVKYFPFSARTATIYAASGTSIASLALWANHSSIHADAHDESEGTVERPSTTLSSLVRTYVVYTLCSFPTLVDWSPTILTTLFAIPGVKQVTAALVRVTFFDQFVGADTAEGALSMLERFRAENKGCLFAYSVEVDEAEAAGKGGKSGKAVQPAHKQAVQEMIHNIEVAADFEDKHLPAGTSKGRRTWVAIKLTALVPRHQSLINFSKYLVQHRPTSSSIPFPGSPNPSDLESLDVQRAGSTEIMSEQDILDLKDLYTDLNAICQRAHDRGVKIIIDAEYSWYQPAVDAFALASMSKFNRLPDPSKPSSSPTVQPLVYNTLQAYLRRNETHLKHCLHTAKVHGYAFGVKLVRGAYHPQELSIHAAARSPTSKGAHPLAISPDELPPVWSTKAETDACYHACAKVLLDAIADDIAHPPSSRGFLSSLFGGRAAEVPGVPTIGVLFGTHNWGSCRFILDGLVQRGLAQKDGTTRSGEAILKIEEDVTERLTMAQLFGMHDNLTDYIVERTKTSAPFVIKYVPYGALTEVLPYLGRRAIENKSVLGQGAAEEERDRAWTEIKRRLLG